LSRDFETLNFVSIWYLEKKKSTDNIYGKIACQRVAELLANLSIAFQTALQIEARSATLRNLVIRSL